MLSNVFVIETLTTNYASCSDDSQRLLLLTINNAIYERMRAWGSPALQVYLAAFGEKH